MSTPEYTAPEILGLILCNFFDKKIEREILLRRVLEESKPWSADIFSLGCVILEILTGVPLTMSKPVAFKFQDKIYKKKGIFSDEGRAFDKIIIL